MFLASVEVKPMGGTSVIVLGYRYSHIFGFSFSHISIRVACHNVQELLLAHAQYTDSWCAQAATRRGDADGKSGEAGLEAWETGPPGEVHICIGYFHCGRRTIRALMIELHTDLVSFRKAEAPCTERYRCEHISFGPDGS